MKKTLLIAAVLLFTATFAHAQGTTNPTGTLTVTIAPEGGLRIDTASTALTSVGTNFSPYTGTTNFTYWIRTSSATTSTIKLQVTSDFAGAGGPSVATPPSAGDQLTYDPTVSGPGTAASAGQVASTSAATLVATFGANAHSARAGNTGSVAWSLTNDPQYGAGGYTATVTYTIAAL